MNQYHAKVLLNYILFYLTEDGIPENTEEIKAISYLMDSVPQDQWPTWYTEFKMMTANGKVN